MNPIIATLLALAVVIAGIIICRRQIKHVKRRRQEEARQTAIQPHIDWAQKVMAAETDEKIVSIIRPSIAWKGRLRLPAIVGEAEDKVRGVERRLWRKRRQQEVREEFEAAAAHKQLSERVKAYLRIGFSFLDEGPELDVMKAKLVEDVAMYVTNLLTSAREGHRQQFIDLVAFTTRPYPSRPSDYEELSDLTYEVPDDWDELVVRYYKTPTLSDFRHSYGVSMRGSLRLLAARALKEESLVLAQVVLAFFDSRAKDSGLWRQEVGVNMMTDLGKMVQRLQVERKLTFA